MDIFRCHILEIDSHHLGTFFHIPLHVGDGGDIIQFQPWVRLQLGIQMGTAGEVPSRAQGPAQSVEILHLADHFEETGPAGDAEGLQRRRDRQADGLVRPAFVSHHQAGIQRIQPPFHTFHRGIERLQIDGSIDPLLFHLFASCFVCIMNTCLLLS